MFCSRCNTEFEEGLRYCKWCGQPLTKTSRETGELLRCPACGDAVRNNWAFCKSCGGRLAAAIEQLAVTECPQCNALVESSQATCTACGSPLASPKASGEGRCQWCGEIIESNSVYCKACGKRLVQSSSAEPAGAPAHTYDGHEVGDPARGVETSLLAEHEQPSPTSIFGRPRITGVLEAEGFDVEPIAPSSEEPATEESPESSGFGFIEAVPSPDAVEEPISFPPASVAAVPSDLAPESQATGPEEAETRWLPLDDRAESSTTRPFLSHPETEGPQVETVSGQPTVPLVGEPRVPEAALGQAAELPTERPAPGRLSQEELQATAAEELKKWDSKVRSLSGSPSAQAPAAPPVHRYPAQTERSAPHVGPPPPLRASRSNLGLFVTAAVLVVLVGAALIVWRFALVDVMSRPGREDAANTASQPQPAPSASIATQPPPSSTTPPDGMVYVDGGLYDVGRDDGDPYARPRRTVTLAPFFIDRTEVTNAQYKRFIDATGHASPEGWSDGNFPAGAGELPVTNVSWQDAADYARWMGRRLPTEAEWEAAARGKDGRVYPWGNRWRSDAANIGTNGTVAVGTFKDGASPFGALDMIGNVWEWTADEFHLYPGNNEAVPAVMKVGVTYRVFRGGAYDGSEIHDATYRGFLDDSKGYPKVGFRTVKNADQ